MTNQINGISFVLQLKQENYSNGDYINNSALPLNVSGNKKGINRRKVIV